MPIRSHTTGISIIIECEICHEQHIYPLDANGQFKGVAACDHKTPIEAIIPTDHWAKLFPGSSAPVAIRH